MTNFMQAVPGRERPAHPEEQDYPCFAYLPAPWEISVELEGAGEDGGLRTCSTKRRLFIPSSGVDICHRIQLY